MELEHWTSEDLTRYYEAPVLVTRSDFHREVNRSLHCNFMITQREFHMKQREEGGARLELEKKWPVF